MSPPDRLPASWIMEAEEDSGIVHLCSFRIGRVHLVRVLAAARPCRAGAPSAEPGGGRASGAAQRRRLDL
jgi:hypothetical protein